MTPIAKKEVVSMEHSLDAYLKRQPTEKLEQFLKDCYANQTGEDFSNAIPVIEKVLSDRMQESAGGHDFTCR